MSPLLSPGSFVSFHYPAHNYPNARSRREWRRVLIQQIRDMAAEPLDDATSKLNPFLNRGRTLLICLDLDKQAVRSFYLESMTNIELIDQPGDYCVCEIEPSATIGVPSIREFDLSLAAAEAQIALLAIDEPEEQFLAIPIQSLR